MYILGISSGLKAGHHDGAAVLMHNGKLLFAAEEERFTNSKHARSDLPLNTIKYILKKFKLNIGDIDYIASPLKTYPYYQERLKAFFSFHFGNSPKIALFEHHVCHAASAYFGSGFNESPILCLDNSGDSKSGGIYYGKNFDIKKIVEFDRDDSLGLFYGMLTQYLGFKMTSDEYKVMGMSSYGEPKYLDQFSKIVRYNEFELNLNKKLISRIVNSKVYTTDISNRQERVFSELLMEYLKIKPRLSGDKILKQHYDLAASGQKFLENIIVNICNNIKKNFHSENLCIAGGVGLNCKANMEVLDNCGIKDIYIPPVPNDPGVALGSAMLVFARKKIKIDKIEHAYFGPKYSNSEIYKILKNNKLKFKEVDDLENVISNNILNGEIVGLFNGKMEFGPRALGSRSIISDPRIKKINDKINKSVKYRELFRPFCPSILYEDQIKFFKHKEFMPFMNICTRALKNTKKNYKSIVHVDGTARVQSVIKNTSNNYYNLLRRLKKKDNLSMLLNTSMNLNNQTLCNTPQDALRTFFGSGMDTIFLENFKISKTY